MATSFDTFDLELLRTFVAVATHQTFAAAAQHINRTQSAVTQQMQKLETQVGLSLFRKTGRNKQLTEQGRHLLRYARDMLSMNDDAMLFLQQAGSSGNLRIGSPHDMADTLLPTLLSHIARFMPHQRLDVTVDRSPYLMDALHRGDIDMTISTREDPRLEGFILRTLPTVWLCSTRFVQLPGQPVPLILGDEPSMFRSMALEALERQQTAWQTVYTSSSPIGIKAAVRAGLGVTPRSMEMLGPDMRILGEKEHLPRLADVSYYLWIRPHTANLAVRQAFELLKNQTQPAKSGTYVPLRRNRPD